MLQGNRRSRVARDYRQPWTKTLDQSAEQGRDAACDFGFTALAVRKTGTVRSVDDRGIGQEFQSRSQNGETADSGIKEQEGGARIHDAPCGLREVEPQVALALGFATHGNG